LPWYLGPTKDFDYFKAQIGTSKLKGQLIFSAVSAITTINQIVNDCKIVQRLVTLQGLYSKQLNRFQWIQEYVFACSDQILLHSSSPIAGACSRNLKLSTRLKKQAT
jgi:hypothetical protein